MRSLADFEQPQEVFLQAEKLPAFFEDNLVDPARAAVIDAGEPGKVVRTGAALVILFAIAYADFYALISVGPPVLIATVAFCYFRGAPVSQSA